MIAARKRFMTKRVAASAARVSGVVWSGGLVTAMRANEFCCSC
jgi:hypothetical protein